MSLLNANSLTTCIPPQFKTHFRVNEHWKTLICLLCETVVFPHLLKTHIRQGHKESTKPYKHLFKVLASCLVRIANQIEDFEFPKNDSLPIQGIKIHHGYCCNHCNNLFTISPDVASKHLSKDHPNEPTSQQTPGYQRYPPCTHKVKLNFCI